MRNPILKNVLPLLMMSEMLGGSLPNLGIKEKEEKKCLVCGNSHYHNNSFCSAECCKAYKNKRKVSPVQPTTAEAQNADALRAGSANVG